MTPWTLTRQAPLSLGFYRQESWSGSPFPPPGDLPDPGVKPVSFLSPAPAGRFFTTGPPGKPIASSDFCQMISHGSSFQFYNVSLKCMMVDFPGGPGVKSLPCNTRDLGSIPGPGRSHMPWNN